MILDDSINHEKISNMTLPELKELCRELRRCILNTVSENGGHLASNLGTVELTAALHFVFDVKEDRIVWDVGHQAYAHKLLTGRYSEFSTLRSLNGISGFTRRKESTADAFISGHSSTSISAAFGIASAMRLQGRRGSVAAVIGDGALTGGMAYEGLNNAGKSKAPLVVILNDNAMSISKSTGALALYLAHIRSTKKYYCAKEHVKSLLSAVPVVGDKLERTIRTAKGLIKDAIYDSSNMFENFGFQYIGPVNGHDLEDLIEALQVAKIMRRPCVVHVFTTKGKGWKPAEENPGEYHAVTKKSSAPSGETFTEAFGRELERIGKSDSRVCGITAAMKYATGMNYFKNACPERFFDVGIAEQHAVTFAAGLAVEGMLPVFAVYSTFLQRGFDQIVHDCAIEKACHVSCRPRGLHRRGRRDPPGNFRRGYAGFNSKHHGVFPGKRRGTPAVPERGALQHGRNRCGSLPQGRRERLGGAVGKLGLVGEARRYAGVELRKAIRKYYGSSPGGIPARRAGGLAPAGSDKPDSGGSAPDFAFLQAGGVLRGGNTPGRHRRAFRGGSAGDGIFRRFRGRRGGRSVRSGGDCRSAA